MHSCSLSLVSARACVRVRVAQVMRWTDGSYLEDQDHWWLSGIHRDVWVYRKPAAHSQAAQSSGEPKGQKALPKRRGSSDAPADGVEARVSTRARPAPGERNEKRRRRA